MIVLVGDVIAGAKSDAILGTDDRAKILDTMRRGLELAMYKANFNVWQGIIDVCSDHCGIVTLPSCIGTVLQVNVGGSPTIFRNSWYNFHVNGFGDACGQACGFSSECMPSPVFQDLNEWSVVAAISEDTMDGDGSKTLIVKGETMDANGNPKQALTIPVSGASHYGIDIPLLNNTANTDTAVTWFRKIYSVYKPVTRGYVKLIAFPIRQMAMAVNIGYYAPTETSPIYQRIKVGVTCKWVRILYRRASVAMVHDHDVVPISSYQAMLNLLKAVRLSDANDIAGSEAYISIAVRLLNEIQGIESGNKWATMQVEPCFGVGTIDFR